MIPPLHALLGMVVGVLATAGLRELVPTTPDVALSLVGTVVAVGAACAFRVWQGGAT